MYADELRRWRQVHGQRCPEDRIRFPEAPLTIRPLTDVIGTLRASDVEGTCVEYDRSFAVRRGTIYCQRCGAGQYLTIKVDVEIEVDMLYLDLFRVRKGVVVLTIVRCGACALFDHLCAG